MKEKADSVSVERGRGLLVRVGKREGVVGECGKEGGGCW